MVKSWRDGAAKAPIHAVDLRLVDFWTPRIAAALAALVTDAQIRAAITAVHGSVPNVAKDAESDLRAQIAAQVADQLGAVADPAQLDAVVRQVIADGYLAGGMAARQQLGPNSVTLDGATGQVIAGLDWDTWEPGDVGAALQAADGGLADLLNNAGIGIKGITGSALDGLGNQIADGVMQGLSVDDIAASLGDWVTGARAERIAHTESARSVTAATLDTYQANGVDEFDLILSAGACDVCVDVADNGPYPSSDSDDAPPIHPYCRCSASPHIPADWFGGGQ